MQRIYFLLIFLFSAELAFPQEYLPVERFTAETGLSDNVINCIYQDEVGFLWIGTRSGLHRYNGYSFERFRADVSDHSDLPSSNILKIFEDSANHIWILTPRGLSLFDQANRVFKSYFIPTYEAESQTVELLDAAIDKGRDLIFILSQNALYTLEISNGKITKKEFQGMEEVFNSASPASVCYMEAENCSYILTPEKLFLIDLDEEKYSQVKIEDSNFLKAEGGLTAIGSGHEANVWFYSAYSIWQIDEKNTAVKLLSFPQSGKNRIISVEENSEGILEILSAGALYTYDPETRQQHMVFKYQIPEADVDINNYLRIKGIFWLCTSEGLYQYNEHGNIFRHHDLNEFGEGRRGKLQVISYDSANFQWFGTESGQVYVTSDEDIVANGSIGGSVIEIQTPFQEDTAIVSTEEGVYLALKDRKRIRFSQLYTGVVKDVEVMEGGIVVIVSQGSLLCLSLEGKPRCALREIQALGNEQIVDMAVTPGQIYILQRHQLVHCSLSDTLVNTLSLKKNSLSALPENTCFYPASSREIIVGTTAGMYIFYPEDSEVIPSYISLNLNNQIIQSVYQDAAQKIWFSTRMGLYEYDRINRRMIAYSYRDGLTFSEKAFQSVCAAPDDEICFYGNQAWMEFYPDSLRNIVCPPQMEISKVEVITKTGMQLRELAGSDSLQVNSHFSMLRFYCTVLDYWNPKLNHYQYCIMQEGKPETWNNISGNRIIHIPRLKTGVYNLKVRGANSRFVWAEEEKNLVISVRASFWRSRTSIIIYIVIFLLSIYFLVFLTTRQLRKLNKEYREKEVIARKVEQQKEELTQKNKNITDSINYAKRIQLALMPSQRLFNSIFRESFILHIPKDIVSGDFYWINEVDGRIYFAAVDCTGHGVPGAFMSIIGFELFRRITEIEKKKRPAEILNSLSQGFETIFRDIEDMTLRDGMDVAFCAIDPEMKVLEFAGAFNPLYLVRDNTISEIKGDRFAVGLNQLEEGMEPQQFQDHVINLKDGDIIYIFTDGYADQFGGPDGKKYKYRRFRHLLLALHQLPMDRQVEFLRRSIMDWKGDLDQVDDILVMGIRINQKKKS